MVAMDHYQLDRLREKYDPIPEDRVSTMKRRQRSKTASDSALYLFHSGIALANSDNLAMALLASDDRRWRKQVSSTNLVAIQPACDCG